MFYVLGFIEEDFKKVQVGIVSIGWEGNFCNMYFNDFVAEIKGGVKAEGLLGLIFYIIGVSDGMFMGIDGMWFFLFFCDIIVDLIEIVVFVQWYDVIVLVVGCDKNMLGVMMALVCFNCFGFVVYGGMIVLGCYKDQKLDIVFVFEVYGQWIVGMIDEIDFKVVIRNVCLGLGVCGGMYMVNIMVFVIEVMGMSLLFNFSILVESMEKQVECYKVGVVIYYLLCEDIKLCDIMICKVFENVVMVIIVFGGFINVVLYMIVIVWVVEVEFFIDDFQKIGDCIFFIVDLKFSGKYVM